jgi:hypothetical protein
MGAQSKKSLDAAHEDGPMFHLLDEAGRIFQSRWQFQRTFDHGAPSLGVDELFRRWGRVDSAESWRRLLL